MNNSSPNEFYDLYLLYQGHNGSELINIPVLIRNHRGNSNSDSANYKLFRRFFLKNHEKDQITFHLIKS